MRGEVVERWRATFERDGAVDIRVGRGYAAGLAAIGLTFTAGAVFLLAIPAGDGLFPALLRRLAAAGGLLLGLSGLAWGGWALLRPSLVARVSRSGVAPLRGPEIPWDEVRGVSLWRTAGGDVPVVRVNPAWRQRVDEHDPGGSPGRRRTARWVGDDRVALRTGARGGAAAVQRFLLWARGRVSAGR